MLNMKMLVDDVTRLIKQSNQLNQYEINMLKKDVKNVQNDDR